jgi:hypothetical protein
VAIIYLEARIKREIGYGYSRNRESDRHLLVEEFFTAAPAIVEPKTRYGFEGAEARLRGFVRDRSGKSLSVETGER